MSHRTLLRIARLVSVGLVVIFCAPGAMAAGQTKFWNITGDTIVKFELAPAGTSNWGPDQCKNDKDDSVDDDERLQIKDVATGSYDARITYKNGRVCAAKALSIVQGKIFSIEANQLKDCSNPQ
jgi:hypothetical protein